MFKGSLKRAVGNPEGRNLGVEEQQKVKWKHGERCRKSDGECAREEKSSSLVGIGVISHSSIFRALEHL